GERDVVADQEVTLLAAQPSVAAGVVRGSAGRVVADHLVRALASGAGVVRGVDRVAVQRVAVADDGVLAGVAEEMVDSGTSGGAAPVDVGVADHQVVAGLALDVVAAGAPRGHPEG